MKTRQHLFIAVFALVCQACAAPAISANPEKVVADASAGSEVQISLSGLPSLALAKMVGTRSQLRNDEIPDGWRLLQGGGGKLADSRDRIVIQGSGDAPLVSVELSPDGERWLVDHGSGRYAIYALEGARVQDVPGFEVQDASAITWRWKDASSLIGITEISPEENLPQYPDADVRPSATLLFLYRLAQDGGTLYALKAPEPPRGAVVRLDGVTSRGALVLSAVVPEEYFGGAPEEQLGVYDVE